MKIWLAQIFTAYAIGALVVGIAVLADEGRIVGEFKGLAVSVSLVIFLAYVPGAFFGPISGVFADLFDKKKIMIISNFVRLVLAVILFFYWEVGIVAYLIILLMSIVGQFFFPSEAASIPILVEKKDLLLANTLFAVVVYSSAIVGIVISGISLRFLEPEEFFLVPTVLFFIGFILVLFLPSNGYKYDAKKDVYFSIDGIRIALRMTLNSIKEIYSYMQENSYVKGVILHLFLVNVLVWTVLGIGFRISREIYNSDKIGMITFVILPGLIGLAIGAVLLHKVFHNNDRVKLVKGGITVVGVGLLSVAMGGILRYFFDLSFIPMVLAILGVFLVGLSGAYLVIPAQTMLNENVDKKFLGRVYGMWLAIVNSLAAFPPLLLSLIADRFTNISFFVLLLGIFVIYYSYKVAPILSGKSLRK